MGKINFQTLAILSPQMESLCSLTQHKNSNRRLRPLALNLTLVVAEGQDNLNEVSHVILNSLSSQGKPLARLAANISATKLV